MQENHLDLSDIQTLSEKIRAYYPNANLEMVEKAYIFSKKAHEGQFRRSGEPYIHHPIGVAEILADLRLDLPSITTALLHDTVEDTGVTLEQIENEFGKDVMELVDGVTKISKMAFRNTHEKQGENIRKMIVAMGKDVRVILVKLADRLHNMRTLNHMPYEKQMRIGMETLDIYAPLASRLGMNSVKVELEDLSFRFTNPEMYYSLAQKITKKKKEREKYIDDVKAMLNDELTKHLKSFRVQGRPKHLYSIYKKMSDSGIDYEHIYDVLAFRVIVDNISNCYEVLGHIHNMWKPIPGRFKDYIAMPKVNNYQSLHTSVIGPGGEHIEVQIRTQEMHLVAERGIAAHWSYKEGQKTADNFASKHMNWLQDLVKQHQISTDSGEFLESIKTELFEAQIYVFTPKGEVKELPEGATAIDFAFSIHTDVGTHTVAARVNGKLIPLRTPLRNGDTVEVITSKTKTPSKDWLKYCVTSKAKSRIRAFIHNEEKKRARVLGEELLEKEFRKHGYNLLKTLKPELVMENDVLRKTGANDLEDLFVRVGYGKLLPKQVFDALALEQTIKPEPEAEDGFFQKIYKAAVKKDKKSRSIISVDGMDDILVRFGKCCHPIPGDPIRGFISRGRGITIHKADCQKVFDMDRDREVEVGWTVNSAPDGVERMVRVRVVSTDSPGLLKLMSETFSSLGMNIQNAQIRTTKDQKAICLFDVSVKDTTQLNNVIQNLQKIKGILEVTRVTQL